MRRGVKSSSGAGSGSALAVCRRSHLTLVVGALFTLIIFTLIIFGWPLLLGGVGAGGDGGGGSVGSYYNRESNVHGTGGGGQAGGGDDAAEGVGGGDNAAPLLPPHRKSDGPADSAPPPRDDAAFVGVPPSNGNANHKIIDVVPPASPIHSQWSQQAIDVKFATSRLAKECPRHCAAMNAEYAALRGDGAEVARVMSEGGGKERDGGWGQLSVAEGGGGKPFFCQADFKEKAEARLTRDASSGWARFSFSPRRAGDVSDGSASSSTVTSVPLILCAIGGRFEGPGGQSYILEAIRQWRLFHPASTSPIHLVLDKAVADGSAELQDLIARELRAGGDSSSSSSSSPSIKVHDTQSLMTDDWRGYLKTFYIQGYMHPGGSRTTGNKNFNQHVSERFYAIEAVMRKEQLSHVMHMENDIMIYDNLLPVLQATVRCGYELATTVVHKKGVIPSVLYIRSADAMRHFNIYLNEFLSCGPSFGKAIQSGYANDMTYLMNYYQLFGAQRLGMLPSWEHVEGENCVVEHLSARRTALLEDGSSLSSPSSSLRGPVLFDVASFGQWYSFAVARNKTRPAQNVRDSMRGRYLDATPPADMTWEYYNAGPAGAKSQKKQQQRLLVPKWKGYRLLSLHVHAKNLAKFRSVGGDHYARESVERGGNGALSDIYGANGGGK